ncbi:FmdB family zinc ribbon protein [uncultured Tessaracoccus sp.]|uniref:FmdB family zinc ribbon protein n=1 Tax=uncultured Tessaracoccus sp. TaxID=905023 RepID=UPI0025DFB4FD|nr:FmdB family zinc ribbon protein [uncultured Tessaracoccus sp.]
MPKYQYRCADCGAELEVQQKFTDDALTQCPTCQGRLRKVFNAVGVVFKGSGFYRTDSRAGGKAGGSSGNGSGQGTSKELSGSSSSQTSSTPATKTSDS